MECPPLSTWWRASRSSGLRIPVLGAYTAPQSGMICREIWINAAILRAGRLDRHIQVQKPDVPTLENIFRHHLGPDLLQVADFLPVALAACGCTGADVEAWVHRAEAAARRARRPIELDEVLQHVRLGKPQMSSEAAQADRGARGRPCARG